MTINSTAHRYYVLPAGAYSNEESSYIGCDTKAEVFAQLTDYSFQDNTSVHVFHGDREPWTEFDPYPDWTADRGPRGGYQWNRA